MLSPDPRLTFANFLDRLAADRTNAEEWHALVVAHYGDTVLEDVRRRCVRLAIGAASRGEWSACEREGFRFLASELRRQATAST